MSERPARTGVRTDRVPNPLQPLATEAIPREGRGTQPDGDTSTGMPLPWEDAIARLEEGGWCWLSTVGSDGTAHAMPVFGVWTGDAVCVASNPKTRKSRNLLANAHCALTADRGEVHLVIEGPATRVTERDDLERVSAAFAATYEWPTEVVGDMLDAPYGAPTSRGGPFLVFAIHPEVAYGLPTNDRFEPTRWRFASWRGLPPR
jgi:hypothetical protein